MMVESEFERAHNQELLFFSTISSQWPKRDKSEIVAVKCLFVFEHNVFSFVVLAVFQVELLKIGTGEDQFLGRVLPRQLVESSGGQSGREATTSKFDRN